ncbi:bifunctional folylpolyglutamate synthase/dihydrofolate synthase [Enterococcus villorum]|uniref:tetrahydrofolate synthase n=2 Tax=Enterococcus villorum TaxID=112904 RepID=A0A511J3K6_9ENTE|nr:folylpolyglutamate synthase/dihydrofolate synthase family protein [Enterococcus villorum]EOH85938.1 FolC protein [Enterococcus villorum ATCC 700913]EOW78483.1 folylpolyglutamate synthase [Enterococcus villorum ATCC 700913]GEL92607.1 tetrahydrofolate synthase [Enterococcus villorum]
MKIEEAITWIHSRLPFGSRPGLDRVEALLEVVGHPERQVKTIHIAGTNGKGSTVTYLRCLLEEAGLTVGTFTSPYIESFNERISINGQKIPDKELIKLVQKYQPLVEQLDQFEAVAGITEFETLTAMAFDYFLCQKVDVAIIEVGLGGLLDSTNVAVPMLTGITTIGLDHTDILGDTIEEIAAQKAGIIKRGVPVVTGNIETPALEVIKKQAKLKNAPIYSLKENYMITYQRPADKWGEVFTFHNETGKMTHLSTAMIGQHQVENAGMAIELYQIYCKIEELPFREKDIKKALKKAQWPGRMEKISEEPLVILDGAHNTHAVKRLVQNLKKEFQGYQINLLFSALKTKDVESMLSQLKEVPNVHIYLTTFESPKAIDLSSFTDLVDENLSIVSLWQFGLAEILEKMTDEDVLVVTGSLYFISEVRTLLLQLGGKHEL